MRKSRSSSVKQARLIESFVAGTTTRTAAALVGVNESTAAYYCLRLCIFIPQALTEEMFQTGQSKWMKGILEVAGKASVDGELPGRCPCLGL